MIVSETLNVGRFISRWQNLNGGRERSNYQLFLIELTEALGLERPSPAEAGKQDYVFERSVTFREPDGNSSTGYIDLYKKGCFVLEAKQSRQKDGKKKIPGQTDLFKADEDTLNLGRRTADRVWDVLMMNARRQAEDYAKALEPSEGWPPFLLVCDVGHCIEVFADFTGQGKNYQQFPDRNGFRIFLEELRDDKIAARLRAIWNEPRSLDPTAQSAKVTREIASRLAVVSKALEARKHNAEDVALFLMRCLFTMFAEDVKLLPERCFSRWLESARNNPSKFKHELAQLWQAMDKGGYATIAATEVKRFNGRFYRNSTVLNLEREEIGELLAAANRNWKEVDPAIFGTLLEQALDEKERTRLGAYYTPRAYVVRIVVVTIMEPLRQEWSRVQATAERLKLEADEFERQAALAGDKSQRRRDDRSVAAEKLSEARGKRRGAYAAVRAFHARLCSTRVIDPACGTGNFLYVAMHLMKGLENEVLNALSELGGQDALGWMAEHAVDPHQFLELEKNERAAAIAELVVWLGYLQLHYGSQSGHPTEPILRDFKNITVMDAVLTWDGYPDPKVEEKNGKSVATYPNARRPDWPEAEFVVGNPPFVAGQDFRRQFGDGYAEALWRTYAPISGGADLVMYWWDRAADLLKTEGTPLQRFGLVTTNSITQEFNRRVVEQHVRTKQPVSILMAIPDHPWTRVTRGSAAVRIAMTVAVAGRHSGVLREVTAEANLDSDQPNIAVSSRVGTINANLTLGVDVTQAQLLRANSGIGADGFKLHGKGFIVRPELLERLGFGRRVGLERYLRPYRNGKDLAGIPRGVWVIDLYGLQADEVRQRYPEVYQHVVEHVKPKREINRRDYRRENWWLFGENYPDLRDALAGLKRYIGTVDTAEHRVFQFLQSAIICDDKVVLVASDDAFHLGILSSKIHAVWVPAQRTRLGQGNDVVYAKRRCFDPFPFPKCPENLKAPIRAIAEELDAHRKERQAENPRLTLTQMYNVLEKLKANEPLDENDERIKTEGLVLVLKELHDKLDFLVFDAYGWPPDLDDEEIVRQLVDLNKERALEETVGKIYWLRPDYQISRFGSDAERARLAGEKRRARELDPPKQVTLDLEDDLQEMKPKFPTSKELEETAAVMRVLGSAMGPLSVQDIARSFAQGKSIEKRVELTVYALARLGHLTSNDDAKTFALRRDT